MMNQQVKHIAFAIAACISTTIHTARYQTVQQRQQSAHAQYNALVEKWNPALSNPSDATLNAVIKKRSAVLKDACERAAAESEINRFKGLRDDLKMIPVRFMCNELDADIATIFTLQENARILDMEDTFDALPFQQLRAAIDTLPCMIEEQEALNRLAPMYKYVLGLAGGLLLASHLSLL
jgi:hypothetical protein